MPTNGIPAKRHTSAVIFFHIFSLFLRGVIRQLEIRRKPLCRKCMHTAYLPAQIGVQPRNPRYPRYPRLKIAELTADTADSADDAEVGKDEK